MSSETSRIATPVRLLITILLGVAGGWVAQRLQLPLAWMIGAMVATMVAALAGLPLALPPALRNVMVAVLGVMLGSGFSPEILARFTDWLASLAALAVYVTVAGAAGHFYLRKVTDYDPVTAYFSSTPGGVNEMVMAGGEMGGDTRIIALIHASRVLVVVLVLPFAFQMLLGYDPATRPPAGQPLSTLGLPDIGILAACAIVGFFAARALKLPAAAVTGPMVLSAAVHLAGWTAATPPVELVAAAQVVLGAVIGVRFAGTSIRLIGRTVVVALGITSILLAVNVGFAFGLHELTDLPVAGLILAYSPGGLAEMSLIALALGLDAALVASHHIVRIFLVVICAPLFFRLIARRAGDES